MGRILFTRLLNGASFEFAVARNRITGAPNNPAKNQPDTTFLTSSPFWICGSCMACTSLLNSESLRLSCKLKAQQTPESVMTGVKISEQLMSFPSQEHRLSMWGESGWSLEGKQGGIECHSSLKRFG